MESRKTESSGIRERRKGELREIRRMERRKEREGGAVI